MVEMLRKSVSILFFMLLAMISCHAQVFNNSKVLSENQYSFGVQPVLYWADNSDAAYLFLHGGIGLGANMDFGFKAGFGDDYYLGIDLEYGISPNFSFAVGAHRFNDFGLDGTLSFNIPLNETTDLYCAYDVDLIFDEKTDVMMWIPIGIQTRVSKDLLLIVENEIGINSLSPTIWGMGFSYFF